MKLFHSLNCVKMSLNKPVMPPSLFENPPKYLLPRTILGEFCISTRDEDHKTVTKILVETVLRLQKRLEIHIGENLLLNGIIEKMNNRLEKLERSNLELKINSFRQSLDEYDEVIGRLHGLLKKYEEENQTLKEIKSNRLERLKDEIRSKKEELAMLESEIEGQSIV